MLHKIYVSTYTYTQTFIECFCIWIKSTNFWNRRAEWNNTTLLEGDEADPTLHLSHYGVNGQRAWLVSRTAVCDTQTSRKLSNGYSGKQNWPSDETKSVGAHYELFSIPLFSERTGKQSLCSFQHLCVSTQAHLNQKVVKRNANKLTTLQYCTKDWLQEVYMVYDGKLLTYRYHHTWNFLKLLILLA